MTPIDRSSIGEATSGNFINPQRNSRLRNDQPRQCQLWISSRSQQTVDETRSQDPKHTQQQQESGMQTEVCHGNR